MQGTVRVEEMIETGIETEEMDEVERGTEWTITVIIGIGHVQKLEMKDLEVHGSAKEPQSTVSSQIL